MTDKQDQRVAAGGTAIQSARDTVIHQGIGSDEIRAIVESLADQLPRMAAVASAIVEERLKAFKEEVVHRFERDETSRKDAFTDPDFIELVVDAQRSYARVGESDAKDVLVDLIAERSKHDSGNRLSYTINESVSVAAKLTRNELSELALSFLIRRTVRHAAGSIELLAQYYSKMFNHFLSDIEKDDHSYNYLVSQRCVTISMGEIALLACWREAYTGLFLKGRQSSDYAGVVDSHHLNNPSLFVPALFDNNGIQPRALNKSVFEEICKEYGLPSSTVDAIWSIAIGSVADDDEFVARFRPYCPRIDEAIALWQSTPMKSLDLTAVGLTIGHARATQTGDFGPSNLSIWVN
jgi:hypothetical protein